MQDSVAIGNLMSSLTMSAHIDMQDNVTSARLIAPMAARGTMSSICRQLPDGAEEGGAPGSPPDTAWLPSSKRLERPPTGDVSQSSRRSNVRRRVRAGEVAVTQRAWAMLKQLFGYLIVNLIVFAVVAVLGAPLYFGVQGKGRSWKTRTALVLLQLCLGDVLNLYGALQQQGVFHRSRSNEGASPAPEVKPAHATGQGASQSIDKPLLTKWSWYGLYDEDQVVLFDTQFEIFDTHVAAQQSIHQQPQPSPAQTNVLIAEEPFAPGNVHLVMSLGNDLSSLGEACDGTELFSSPPCLPRRQGVGRLGRFYTPSNSSEEPGCPANRSVLCPCAGHGRPESQAMMEASLRMAAREQSLGAWLGSCVPAQDGAVAQLSPFMRCCGHLPDPWDDPAGYSALHGDPWAHATHARPEFQVMREVLLCTAARGEACDDTELFSSPPCFPRRQGVGRLGRFYMPSNSSVEGPSLNRPQGPPPLQGRLLPTGRRLRKKTAPPTLQQPEHAAAVGPDSEGAWQSQAQMDNQIDAQRNENTMKQLLAEAMTPPHLVRPSSAHGANNCLTDSILLALAAQGFLRSMTLEERAAACDRVRIHLETCHNVPAEYPAPFLSHEDHFDAICQFLRTDDPDLWSPWVVPTKLSITAVVFDRFHRTLVQDVHGEVSELPETHLPAPNR